MIDGIEITNFKSHKDTKIEFNPGVNVLVGLSDHGKTNVIRAINWVANNRPLGDGVINRDATEASVNLLVSHAKGNETDTIRRIKGSKVNEYVLNGGEPFTAFGSDPPPQIRDALNFSEINLQRQFEPYFLVFDPPGQVATFIRSITKLDEIDRVIDSIAGQIDKNKTNVRVCESETGDVLARLGAAVRVDLDGLQQRIDRAKILVEQNKRDDQIIDRLANLVEQIDAIKPIELPEDLDAKLEAIKQRTQRAADLQSRVSRLRSVISSLQQATREVIVLPDLTGVLNHRTTLERQYNESMKKRDRLMLLIDSIQNAASTTTVDEQIRTAEHEVEDLRGQLTTCPTCGSELNEESREKVLHGHRE